jgi:ketosteroid isomerase-like protein
MKPMSDLRVPEGSSDEVQLRTLIEAWAHAVRTMDVEGIVDAHAPDVLLFDSVIPFQARGADAYRAAWLHFFPSSWRAGICRISELRVTAGDSVAFCSGLLRCGGIEADGSEVAATLRLTMGFHKLQGRWWILHEHYSEPLA